MEKRERGRDRRNRKIQKKEEEMEKRGRDEGKKKR